MNTPKQLGFFMPPEWHPHSHCRIAWPHRIEEVWLTEAGLTAACRAYAKVAQAIAQFEPVTVLVNAAQQLDAVALCGPKINTLIMPHDDAWHRDSGPTFVISQAGELAGIHWQFNDYGNKEGNLSTAYANDAVLAKKLLEVLNIPCFDAPWILEGGAFHVDGAGNVLTTEQCLLNPNRANDLSKADWENALSDYLGVNNVIWLKDGLANDDTDGHIDTIACFVGPGHVLAATCDDPNDENYAALQENLARLRMAKDAQGRPLTVHTVPIPPPRYNPFGLRLALSYVNFYLANGAVIMCSFDAPEQDAAAYRLIQSLFPDRVVVQLPALAIYVGGGGIHCMTQQQPLATSTK